MRPGTSVLVSSSRAWSWTSPLPYVFGGLGAIAGLIAVALVVLVCTRRKLSSQGSGAVVLPCMAEKPIMICPMEMEPKVVVVMAGENMPTFLAKPLPVASTSF